MLRGTGDDLQAWQAQAATPYAPRRLRLAIPDDAVNRPGLLAERGAQGGTTAYVCTGTQCSPPVMTQSEFATLLHD